MEKNVFASRLTALRKERGISQKEAAAALEVSGALLSHYENGIRECGLDFLRKAAAYYDVTSDYLLGISDSKRVFTELLDSGDRLQDGDFRLATIFRSAARIGEFLVQSGDVTSLQIQEFFAMSIYLNIIYAAAAGIIPKSWVNLPTNTAFVATETALHSIYPMLGQQIRKSPLVSEEPLCMKTTIEKSEEILKRLFSALHDTPSTSSEA